MLAWGSMIPGFGAVKGLVLLQPAIMSVPERQLEGLAALGHPSWSLQLLGYF